MKTGIAAGVLIASVSLLRAQTGVSGEPGIPTAMAPLPDASSSPVLAAPPAAAPSARPAAPPTRPAAVPPANPPRPAAAPPAAPPASSSAAVAEVPAETPKPKRRKREGAAFYAPYLSSTDTLDQTITDLTARVAARPDEPGLRNDLGNLLARRGFAREAVEQYRRAAKLDREFFLADYNEGLLWEKEGRVGPAMAAYHRSIRRKPGFPLSRFHLGFLYEKEGMNSRAVAEYAKALRIDPSLRWPARNPLVVQTRLLYRASLVNYDRDLAGANLAGDAEFADHAVWERLQPQVPVDTAELEPEPEAEPQEIAPAAGATGRPAAAPIIGGKAAAPVDPRRQQLIDQFRRTRPGRPNQAPSRTVIQPPFIPPPPQAPPPAAVEPPPEDENAPTPAMEEPPPPPPVGSTARR